MTNRDFSPVRLAAVLAVAGSLMLAGSAGPAAAQGTAAQRAGCEADAFKFCSQYIPWVHSIENCLFKNIKKVSPACRVQLKGGQ
ncbi:MAG: hypothetical protein AB7K35_13555 [Pseudorhodoplanes sp.]